MAPVLGLVDVTFRSMPPSTTTGADTPLSLVLTGNIESRLIFILSITDRGMTVSCAPVSNIAGFEVVLPGLFWEFLNRGRLSPRNEYAGLSSASVTWSVGLSQGRVGNQPLISSWMW